jgi:hypothetical protein
MAKDHPKSEISHEADLAADPATTYLHMQAIQILGAGKREPAG